MVVTRAPLVLSGALPGDSGIDKRPVRERCGRTLLGGHEDGEE